VQDVFTCSSTGGGNPTHQNLQQSITPKIERASLLQRNKKRYNTRAKLREKQTRKKGKKYKQTTNRKEAGW
jgi:hypothetical protein